MMSSIPARPKHLEKGSVSCALPILLAFISSAVSAGAAAIGAAAVYIYKSGETPEEIVEVRPFLRFTEVSTTPAPNLETSEGAFMPWCASVHTQCIVIHGEP